MTVRHPLFDRLAQIEGQLAVAAQSLERIAAPVLHAPDCIPAMLGHLGAEARRLDLELISSHTGADAAAVAFDAWQAAKARSRDRMARLVTVLFGHRVEDGIHVGPVGILATRRGLQSLRGNLTAVSNLIAGGSVLGCVAAVVAGAALANRLL